MSSRIARVWLGLATITVLLAGLSGSALAFVLTGGTPPDFGPAPGEPYTNLSAGGLFVASKTDLYLAGSMPINITRTYRTRDAVNAGSSNPTWNIRPFGMGVNFSYGLFLYSSSEVGSGTYTNVSIVLPDGGQVPCTCTAGNNCSPYTSATYVCNANPGPFFNSIIAYDPNVPGNGGANGGWDLTLTNGTVYKFGLGAPLQSLQDRFGNALTMTRVSGQGQNANITQISSSSGRYVNFTYGNGSFPNLVTQITDNAGRSVSYTYDGSERLSGFTDAAGNSTSFTYVGTPTSPAQLGDLATATDAMGNKGSGTYDSSYRIMKLTGVLGSASYSYTLSGGGTKPFFISECDITDPRGFVRKLGYDGAHYVISDTRASGKPEQQIFSYTRNSAEYITMVTDPLGRQITYGYDQNGNVASINIAGMATYYYVYTPFDQLDGFTNALGYSSTGTLDSNNNLVTFSDPASETTKYSYNSQGQVTSITDPVGNKTTYNYNSSGDLASIVDPLGNTSNLTYDGAGRLITFRDPLRESTNFGYDADDRTTSIQDPNLNTTSYQYDKIGDLTTVTDPNKHSTTLSYSFSLGEVSECDPLNNCQDFVYDGLHNLTGYIDGRGLTTSYTYDALNRLTNVQYNSSNVSGFSQSSIAYTWDAGNRLTKAVDSTSGTITRQPDNLDRLMSETTPQGTVSYTYVEGTQNPSQQQTPLRAAMTTTPNQMSLSYGYDFASRLASISGGASLSVSYNGDGRPTSITLPNGVVASYTYDGDSHPKSISYNYGSTNLGSLGYTYDAAGHLTQVNGSLAAVNVPSQMTATYLKNNQLATLNGNSATEDANGNLTKDSLGNTYSWDERNHLLGVNTGGSNGIAFEYDGLGRRYFLFNNVNSTTTNYLYDGLNPIQQKRSGSLFASSIDGLGLDDFFTWTDTSTVNLLKDALNSTIALTNSSGAIQTNYTYQPFGTTSVSGTSSNNTFQFAGRELDPVSGLYYMRNRYYDPTLQRFLSPDPLGFNGGDSDLYRYVGNDPVDFTDPLGLKGGSSGGGGGGGPAPDDPPDRGPGQGCPGCQVPGGGYYDSNGMPITGTGLGGSQVTVTAPGGDVVIGDFLVSSGFAIGGAQGGPVDFSRLFLTVVRPPRPPVPPPLHPPYPPSGPNNPDNMPIYPNNKFDPSKGWRFPNNPDRMPQPNRPTPGTPEPANF